MSFCYKSLLRIRVFKRPLLRLYSNCSDSDSDSNRNEIDYSTLILDRALKFVPKYGWTVKSILAGVKEEGLPDTCQGIIEDGPIDLVHHFYKTCNKELLQQMYRYKEEHNSDFHVGKFIEHFLLIRLEMMRPNLEHWNSAVLLMGQPPNAPRSIELLMQMLDDVWYMAGDRSFDMNWYSKRLSLAAVYLSTQVFMLSDADNTPERNKEFLAKRLKEVALFGEAYKSFERNVTFAANASYAGVYFASNLFKLATTQVQKSLSYDLN